MPPQQRGLKRGNNHGNSGGRSYSKEWLARQAYIAEVVSGKAVPVAADPSHPQWASVYKLAAEYAHGKPARPVEHQGGVTVTIRRNRHPGCSSSSGHRSRRVSGLPKDGALGVKK